MTNNKNILFITDIGKNNIICNHKYNLIIKEFTEIALIDPTFSKDIDVILTNFGTNGINGIDYYKWIKAFFPHAHLIVVNTLFNHRVSSFLNDYSNLNFLAETFDFYDLETFLLEKPERKKIENHTFFDFIILSILTKSTSYIENNLEGSIFIEKGKIIYSKYKNKLGDESFFELVKNKTYSFKVIKQTQVLEKNIISETGDLISEVVSYMEVNESFNITDISDNLIEIEKTLEAKEYIKNILNQKLNLINLEINKLENKKSIYLDKSKTKNNLENNNISNQSQLDEKLKQLAKQHLTESSKRKDLEDHKHLREDVNNVGQKLKDIAKQHLNDHKNKISDPFAKLSPELKEIAKSHLSADQNKSNSEEGKIDPLKQLQYSIISELNKENVKDDFFILKNKPDKEITKKALESLSYNKELNFDFKLLELLKKQYNNIEIIDTPFDQIYISSLLENLIKI